MAANTEKNVDELKAELAELRSDVSKLVETVRKLTGDATAEGRERAKQTAEWTKRQARDTVDAFEHEIEERPLVSIAAAFGIGFIIGKLLDR